MKVVACSDWHWDARTSGFVRAGDVELAVGEVVAAAIGMSADLFLFLGDLCDPDPSKPSGASAFAGTVAAELAAAGVASRWLTGNHDVIEDGSGRSTLEPIRAVEVATNDFATLVDRPFVETFRDVNLVYLPYVPRSRAYSPEEFVRGVEVGPGPVLVLGHLNLEGIEPGSETTDMPRGRDVFWPLDAIASTRWSRRALLLGGHYHRAQVYRGIVVVGAIQRFTHGEEGNEPGYLVAEVS